MEALFILAFISLIITTVFGFFVLRGYRSQQWRKTPARITYSDSKETMVMASNVPMLTYELELEYEYQVRGRTYTGKRLGSMQNTSGEKKAVNKLLAKYPVGTEIIVHVDPEDPEMAVVGAGVSVALWIATIFFGLATLTLLFFAVAAG